MSTKKLMLHKKSISCQQKQHDAAPKKYFVPKKVIIFSGTARHNIAFVDTQDEIFTFELRKLAL